MTTRWLTVSGVVAALAVGTLVLSACSADSPAGRARTALDDVKDLVSSATEQAPEDDGEALDDWFGGDAGDDGDNGDNAPTDHGSGLDPDDLHPLTFLIPETSNLPAGWVQQETSCEADPQDSSSSYGFGHPSDWTRRGLSIGSGGGDLHDNITMSFDSGVSIGVTDAGHDDLEPKPGLHTPFDHEWSVSGTHREDEDGVLLFEVVATAELGDQSVDIYHQKPGQDVPDLVDNAGTYKAIIPVVEVPAPYADPNYRTVYKIAEVNLPADLQDDVDLVSDLISAISLPDCTRKDFTNTQELLLEVDLDDDGHIYSQQDVLDELNELFGDDYCEENELPQELCDQYKEMMAQIEEN